MSIRVVEMIVSGLDLTGGIHILEIPPIGAFARNDPFLE
jgi:hypothetical protein